jgi:endonuclease YncB( thermonuclease family)
MYYKLLAILVLLAIIVVGFWRWSVARHTPSERQKARAEERAMRLVHAEVVSVDSGADLTVKVGRRDVPCHLAGIEIPATVAAEAKANIVRLTESGSVSIQVAKIVEKTDSGVDLRLFDRGPFNAVCLSGGVCLQLGQLEAGMARCVNDQAPDTWQEAQKVAQKAKKGVWK